ncbi:MAG: DMT family transporter [Gammaproteobacteria bacterium]|nr:DMT family transporter [Gammaproteobacteria bacterium]
MSGTLLSFTLMAIGARELTDEIDIFQTLLFRSAIGLVIMASWLAYTGKLNGLRDGNMRLHLTRNVFHFGGQYGWFLGIGLLPLAEVFALEFTVPVWTMLIAVLFLDERLTWAKGICVALGLAGVAVIVGPGAELIEPAALIVLGAALCYGIANGTTKALSDSESAAVVLFYMCAIQLPIALGFSLGSLTMPVGIEWLWLFVVALTALSAHYCMTRAMACAEATTVAALDFLRLPLIVIVGIALYNEPFKWTVFLGAALMLAGNVINLRDTQEDK